MIRVKVGVTWGMIFIYVACIILGLCFVLGLSGCGTRKVATDRSKVKTEQREESKTEKESSSNSEEKETIKEENKAEIKNDITTTETTKRYDSSGKLIEEHTKTIVDKSAHSSSSTKKYDKRRVKVTRWIERTKTYKLQIVTTKEKHKVVDADNTVAKNFGGSWFLILGLVIVVGAVFLYFYLKRK